MINGAHSILYSTDAGSEQPISAGCTQTHQCDVGDGGLIVGLPPAKLAVHSSEKHDVHEFYLMCNDADEFVAEMVEHQTACDSVRDQGSMACSRR